MPAPAMSGTAQRQAIRQVWLDWERPCLPAATQWLLQSAGEQIDHECDLSRVMCVLPSRRAGRVLIRLLAEESARSGKFLTPPVVVTPAGMLDRLLPATGPVATEFESILAWTEALKQCDDSTLLHITAAPPTVDDWLGWHGLAAQIAVLHRELAGTQCGFAEVGAQAERLELPAEGDRWAALGTVKERYLAILSDRGLNDPDEMRIAALQRDDASCAFEQVILIGVTDLPALHREALRRFDGEVNSLIHASETEADAFDEFGCPRVDSWMSRTLPVRDEQIIVADRPEDQAQATLSAMAAFDGEYLAEEIVVGVGDASLIGPLQRAGDWIGQPLRSAAGRAITQTGPARLLALLADWIEHRRFAHLAALLRHPDIEQWLLEDAARNDNEHKSIEDWISLLDRYFSDFLHERLTGHCLGDQSTQAALKRIHDRIERLAEPFRAVHSKPLGEWSSAILDTLRSIYGGIDVESGNQDEAAVVAACKALSETVESLAAAHEALQPRVVGAAAIRLFLATLENESLADEIRRGQIEMLGWLELHLDPVPALIITGFNDGSIPQAVTSHPFLPDQLRRALGLPHNDQRLARDAYLLEAMMRSRKSLTIIAGRRDARSDPLPPSRLLLLCDDETLPGRVKRLSEAKTSLRWPRPAGLGAPCEKSHFVIPPAVKDIPQVEVIRVTDFARFIACPYRYMLKRVLRLEAITDEAVELDPLIFGTVAHDVLMRFGRALEVAGSSDSETIEKWLVRELRSVSRERFGDDPMPAVRVQLSRLEQRLRGFAQRQAHLRSEGWTIDRCEWELPEATQLPIPDQPPVRVKGKIDRIDRHEQSGAWRIIDYKSGDTAKSPHKSHHDSERIGEHWTDLQLPLYRHLAAQHGIDGQVELGYIVLPRDPADVAFLAAQWTDDDIHAAIDEAARIVQRIRAGEFEINPDFDDQYDEFARICQTTVFGRAEESEDEA